MRSARGRKDHLIKTWGIHALHHGWTYAEVTEMYTKLLRKTVAEISEWAKAQRSSGWAKVS